MRRFVDACLIAAALSVPAWPQVDFDRGMDMRTVMEGLPPAPVPAGMELVLFREDAEGLTVAFQDQRASRYIGGATRLIFEIREARRALPDPVVFDMDMTQPVGPYYEFSFKDVRHKLRAGGKYYVVWSFQRLGEAAAETVQPGGRSRDLVLALPRG
jgi:hypothetical protein